MVEKAKQYKVATIPVGSMQLDVENPRLPVRPDEARWTQPDAIQYFSQRGKTKELAKSIAELRGLNPTRRFMVMKSESNSSEYTVLDGNRRLAALRLLNRPSLADSSSSQKAFQSIAKGMDAVPTQAECVVFSDRESAAPWIALEHNTGEDGATFSWDATQIARFQAIVTGKKPRHGRALALAEYLLRTKAINSELFDDIPITTLDRLLSDPYVREKLGTETFDDTMPNRPRKAALRIVTELASGVIKVGDVFDKKLRKQYIDRVVKDPTHIEEPEEEPEEAPNAKGKKQRNQKLSWHRKHLVPTSCVLKIKDAKLLEMYSELRNLNVDKHTNAVAVLFRAFFELLMISYMRRHKLPDKVAGKEMGSNQVFAAVKDHLVNAKKLDASALKPVNIALNEKHHFMSVQTMHAYVHEQFVFPDLKRLNQTWDAYEPFIRAATT